MPMQVRMPGCLRRPTCLEFYVGQGLQSLQAGLLTLLSLQHHPLLLTAYQQRAAIQVHRPGQGWGVTAFEARVEGRQIPPRPLRDPDAGWRGWGTAGASPAAPKRVADR